MFENIGGKIKTLATVITIIGIVGSVIFGLIILARDFLLGLLIIIVGSLASWIGSFFAYGFGQLIENTEELIAINRQAQKKATFSHANSTKAVSHSETSSATKDMIQPEQEGVKSEKIHEKDCIPVKVYKNGNGKITCPDCHFEQPAHRQVCWKCGRPFDKE